MFDSDVKLLLVEADEVDATVIHGCVRNFVDVRCQVRWERTYESGLASALDGTFDVCLLAHRVGDRDGIDLLRDLRIRGFITPTVLLAGGDANSADLAAFVASATDYLAKGDITAPMLERAVRYAAERGRTDRRLREKESLLARAERLAHIGSWEWEPVADATYLSEETYRIFGLPVGQPVTSTTFLDVVHAADRARVGQEIAALGAGGGAINVECRVVWPSGEIRWISISGGGIEGSGGASRIIGVVRDVTDARAAEAALRASEERLSAIAEHATEMVGILDANGTFAYLSPNHTRVLGWDDGELLERAAAQVTHPDDRRRVHAIITRVRAGTRGYAETTVFRALHKDGSYRTVEMIAQNLLEHPAVRGIACNVRDITQRVAAEAELRFQAHLLDTVQQAVIAALPDGTVMYWNGFAEQLFGWKREEVVGRPSVEFTRSELTPEEMARIMERLEDGESWSGEVWMTDRRGRRFPAYKTTSPIFGDDGRLVGVVGVATDVSDRRELEDRLRHSQKLEALGKLAGGVAHDFNNVLTAIQGHGEFLLKALEPGSAPHNDAQEIVKASQRAGSLTRQLLVFSRHQMVDKRVVDANQLMADLERMLSRLMHENIELQLALDPSAPFISADAGQIEQLVMNLVVNARDAMPRGGIVKLSTRAAEVEPAMAARRPNVEPGTYLEIEVADTGGGIEPSILPKIFDPFFTTKTEGRGTGLGLATVYGVARQAGGFVDVQSTVGRGTTFHVFIPATADVPAPAVDSTPVRPAHGREWALVVEDQDVVRSVTRRMLTAGGYRVIEARDGLEALRILRARNPQIDVVVTDAVMPNVGGIDLARAIHSEGSTMPVVLISGYTDQELTTYGAPGIRAVFLRKPFRSEQLLRATREAIEGARRLTPSTSMRVVE